MQQHESTAAEHPAAALGARDAAERDSLVEEVQADVFRAIVDRMAEGMTEAEAVAAFCFDHDIDDPTPVRWAIDEVRRRYHEGARRSAEMRAAWDARLAHLSPHQMRVAMAMRDWKQLFAYADRMRACSSRHRAPSRRHARAPRRHVRRSGASSRTAGSDPGGDPDPPAAPPGSIFEALHVATSDLTGPERALVFLAYPPRVQLAAWLELAEQVQR